MSFAGGSRSVSRAFTVLQVHCLQRTFDESQLSDVTPVSRTSVPVR